MKTRATKSYIILVGFVLTSAVLGGGASQAAKPDSNYRFSPATPILPGLRSQAPNYVRSNYGPDTPATPGGPFTIERLYALAQANRTIEATIQALPESVRARYVLMYRSRSLQKASFDAPRAILFEDDGSFAVAFNGGDPTMRGFDKLEALQFRAAEKRWEFREIDFANGGDGPVLSPANPRKCLECHQSANRIDVDPRPNWEPYNIWPGAYGSDDGEPGRSLEGDLRYKALDPTGLAPLIVEQKDEATRLGSFLQGPKVSHPRYKALGEFLPRTTLDLTDVFVDLNDQRVGRLTAATPDWDVYRYLYAEALICSGYSGATSFAATAPAEILGPLQNLFNMFKPGLPPQLLRGDNSGLIEFAFDARGVDTSDWGMDFKTGGRFAFNDRFGSPSYPLMQMRRGLAPYLEVPLVSGLNSGLDSGPDCQSVRSRATEVVTDLRARGRLDEVGRGLSQLAAGLHAGGSIGPTRDPNAMLARCATCHSTGENSVPILPFDNFSRLRAALGKTGYKRGTLLDEVAYRLSDFADQEDQMPPAGVPTALERERLLVFLRGL